MGVDQYLFWALLLFVGVVLPALPAIVRAWRTARRPANSESERERMTDAASITKIAAAGRQLDAAIELFFQGGDAVPVATLAYNAFEISATLAKRDGKRDWLDQVADVFQTTGAEVRKVFHEPRNFFKHADRDPDEVLPSYEDRDAMHLLAMTVLQFGEVAERSIHMWSLLVWFYAVEKEQEAPEALRDLVAEFAYVRALPRPAQLDARAKVLAELRRRAK